MSDDDDEDLTTSPSLTFGIVESSAASRGHHSKADYRALHRRNSGPSAAENAQVDNNTVTTRPLNGGANAEIVGGTKKKSYKG